VKYVLVIYEGAADVPRQELEGATPLELARGVHATHLLSHGRTGCLQWPDDGHAARGEFALACLLGLTPGEAQTLRRGPVEAAGVPADPSRWTYAYRGNFVTVDGTVIRENRVSGLSLDETMWLTEALKRAVSDLPVLMEVAGPGRVSVMFDRMDGDIDPGTFPVNGGSTENENTAASSARSIFMRASQEVLSAQSVNEVRVDLGENPANLVWLWGGGAPVSTGRPFIGAPLKAAMVSNSPLARGMAGICGMKHVDLGDPWGEAPHPEVIGRDALAACIDAHELTVVYAEAPREGGSFGTPADKVKALDRLDIHLLARVREAIEAARGGEARLMLAALPEEGVALATTPVFMCGPGVKNDGVFRWDEQTCREGGLGPLPAHRCLSCLIGD